MKRCVCSLKEAGYYPYAVAASPAASLCFGAQGTIRRFRKSWIVFSPRTFTFLHCFEQKVTLNGLYQRFKLGHLHKTELGYAGLSAMHTDNVQPSDALQDVTETTQSASNTQRRRTVWRGVEHGAILPSEQGQSADCTDMTIGPFGVGVRFAQ